MVANLHVFVREALSTAYARPVVAKLPDDRVAVLPGKAIERARIAVAEAFGEEFANEHVVELDSSMCSHYAIPPQGLKLWRQHGQTEADGELVTELVAGDPPVMVVVEDSDFRLIRTLDGAQGWIGPTQQLGDQTEPPQSTMRGDVSELDVNRFIASVAEFLETSYVWGGTSRAGLDCSGIVQRAAWNSNGVWLPRHSRALMKIGERVAPKKVLPGDVLVLQRRPETVAAERLAQQQALAAEQELTGRIPAHGPAVHPMHVAVVVPEEQAIHASRDAMQVVREPLSDLLERYRILAARRFGTKREL